MDGWMDGCMYACIHAWIDGRMDVWMGGLVDELQLMDR